MGRCSFGDSGDSQGYEDEWTGLAAGKGEGEKEANVNEGSVLW